jgi:hypothetical protein
VNNLASLVGVDWLQNVQTATGRKIHPLQYPLVQTGEAWERWRAVFDDAVHIVQQLVTSDSVARDRLIAKVKSPDFWSCGSHAPRPPALKTHASWCCSSTPRCLPPLIWLLSPSTRPGVTPQ